MKKIKELLKFINKQWLLQIAFGIIILNFVLDLDYLMYGVLNQIGLPLPSTLLHFIIYPLFVLKVYLFIETDKKKIFYITVLVAVVYGGYFVLHHLFVKDLFEQLYLTNRFFYSVTTELRYVLELIIPFSLIYAFYKLDPNEKMVKRVVIFTSIFISFPLFLSNLFVIGPSTYQGYTQANFISWFFGIYEEFHPRQLATQFYFSEGNTTGIVLFSIYPILIHYFYKSKKTILYALLIIVQGLAMYVLATRVATYGALLILALMLVMYPLVYLFRKEKINFKKIIILASILAIFASMFNYTPAVVNQTIDSENDGLVLNEDYQRLEGKDAAAEGESLIPGTAEYNYFYQYMFEQYYFLLTIPSIYYEWYYPYEIDPKFYVDLIFEYPLYERASGRQFQAIFFDYKWNKLTASQKLLGFSYSRFMNGSIVLEQDFLMQQYTYGYLGYLLTGPWLALLVYIVFKSLRKIKESITMERLVFGLSFSAMLASAYQSGHVLDQFFATTMMALIVAILLRQVNNKA